MQMIEKVNTAVELLKESGFDHPEVGIILGTGLNTLVDSIEIQHELNYSDIPHFPIATIAFHKGKLICGHLAGKKTVVMQGRFHYYEGHSMEQVVFPVRVMQRLGINKLIISNAAGNMNLDWNKGELMLIEDHINLQPESPLRGHGVAAFGPLFTDMSQPYDKELNNKIGEVAKEKKIVLHRGVYVAVAGPNLETKAEYRYLRMIGADVVGMSTVPEVIAANQMGLPVAAVSVLTDNCDPDHLEPIDMENVMTTVKSAEKKLVVLFKELMSKI